MLLNDYSVRVIGGDEVAGGYVEMKHGQVYSLQLRNNNPSRCDAEVVIDGKTVGTFRLEAYGFSVVTHPVNNDGRFTFYKAGTPEAYRGQLSSLDKDFGLVSVTFTPEVRRVPQYKGGLDLDESFPAEAVFSSSPYEGALRAASKSPESGMRNYSAGGTALSGHSSQLYGQAADIEHDYSRQTTINLRLVIANDSDIRPLTQDSNPVPPRVW